MRMGTNQSGFRNNQATSTLSDQDATKISQETYDRNRKEIVIEQGNGEVIYNVVETIEDESTGLHGYVLENDITEEIIISFEGTQTKNGMNQTVNDINEDLSGVVLGTPKYTEKETGPVNYNGSPYQDSLLASGQAEIKDGKFVQINTNQFTEADKVVQTYIEEHGADNITFVGHSLGGALAEYFAITYDSHAITFAAPDIYNLLTKEEKKRVANGDFNDNIISYAYPDDVISSFSNNSIGSTYFLAHPDEFGGNSFKNHPIENYTGKDMFDEDGYFIPDVLFDETLFGHPEKSPLALKNSGIENFNILIKTYIMKSFASDAEKNATLVENTEKSLQNFIDYYLDTMLDLKNKYNRLVGTGNFDKLSSLDVYEAFSNIGEGEQNGIPLIFSMEQYEEILKMTNDLYIDTEEIAFHMNQMSKDFEEADSLLAQWLQY